MRIAVRQGAEQLVLVHSTNGACAALSGRSAAVIQGHKRAGKRRPGSLWPKFLTGQPQPVKDARPDVCSRARNGHRNMRGASESRHPGRVVEPCQSVRFVMPDALNSSSRIAILTVVLYLDKCSIVKRPIFFEVCFYAEAFHTEGR